MVASSFLFVVTLVTLSQLSFSVAQVATISSADTTATYASSASIGTDVSQVATSFDSSKLLTDTRAPPTASGLVPTTLSRVVASTTSGPGDLSGPTSGTVIDASTEHGQHISTLSVPAILGITLGCVFIVTGVLAIFIWAYMLRRQRQRQQQLPRKKSLLAMEFADPPPRYPQISVKHDRFTTQADTSKPLPVARDSIDNLSRSSTIIADAAEVAKINRKASAHQATNKQEREKERARNHTLQILITNENGQESVHSPTDTYAESPSSPTTKNTIAPECNDNDGDNFQRRPSKL